MVAVIKGVDRISYFERHFQGCVRQRLYVGCLDCPILRVVVVPIHCILDHGRHPSADQRTQRQMLLQCAIVQKCFVNLSTKAYL